MRICVVTSTAAAAEPRAPRHALAAKAAFPDAEVIFVDHRPCGVDTPDPPGLAASGLERRTITYPWVRDGRGQLVWRKIRVALARALARTTGRVTEPVFGTAMIGLTNELTRQDADIYWAHNIETLLPAAAAAARRGAGLIFDCMEYYSDMGEGQDALARAAARAIEARWLPRCALVTASSEALAEVLAREYGLAPPLALYNTPSVVRRLPARRGKGLSLYWRNAVVGLSQRGLDDALAALTLVPADVTLTVQGRSPADGGARLKTRIGELGLDDRVTVLPPFAPGEAVTQAAGHDVGLCLERRGPRNHDLTVSNKLFDYLMAGLVVIASDLPGLRAIVERSGGGLVFEPGSPQALAEQIIRLHQDPALRTQMAANARAYALAEGNLEVDMARLAAALAALPPPTRGQASVRKGE